MPAIDEEILAAEEEGVHFVFLAAPHRILGDAKGNVKAMEIVKTRLGEYDNSGRRRPVPTDEVQRFDCDGVILAVGETFDLDFCRASGLELKDEGTIKVNRFTLETSRAGLLCRRRRDYRGLQCVQCHGRRQTGGAGRSTKRLMGEQRWERLFPEFDSSHASGRAEPEPPP